MNNMVNLGAKGIVVGPIDSAAISARSTTPRRRT
jgi:ABC-type sugar transport system substrate-binding protein